MSAFLIVQTKEQTELAVSVHRNAEVKDIRLARAKATSEDPEVSLKRPLELEVKVRARTIDCPPLTIEVDFRLAAIGRREPKAEAFSVDCVFKVEYELRPGFKPTPEQIRAFKDGNAIFNCWSYCRQYAQETVTRMGFPPAILPFLRVVTVDGKTRVSQRGQPRKKESPLKSLRT
jgi:hypothetical protein